MTAMTAGRRKEWQLLVGTLLLQRKEAVWDEFHDMAVQNGFDIGFARVSIEVMVLEGELERTGGKYHLPRPRTIDSEWRW